MSGNPPAPVRMVVDSSVLLPILASREREDHWLVKMWDEGVARPLVNDGTIAEIRRKLLEWSPTPKPLQAQRFVQMALRPYERNWEIVPLDNTQEYPQCRDPADQMFIDLGIAGRADFVLTRDHALLEMDGLVPFKVVDEDQFQMELAG